jgi:hypothetical protein
MDAVISVPYVKADGTVKTYNYPKERYADASRRDGRRSPDGKRKGWQIAEMWDQHHEIARRLVLGQSNVEIAEALGVTRETVSNVKNSPVVQDKLALLRAARDCDSIDLGKEIAEMAPMALKRIREAIETGTVLGKEVYAASILKEANSLLDREMGMAIQRIDSRNLNATIGPDDLEDIKRRAAELLGGRV